MLENDAVFSFSITRTTAIPKQKKSRILTPSLSIYLASFQQHDDDALSTTTAAQARGGEEEIRIIYDLVIVLNVLQEEEGEAR